MSGTSKTRSSNNLGTIPPVDVLFLLYTLKAIDQFTNAWTSDQGRRAGLELGRFPGVSRLLINGMVAVVVVVYA